VDSDIKEGITKTVQTRVSNQTSANEASNQALAVQRQRAPLAPILQQQGQIHQAMMGFNPGFQPSG